MYYDLSIVKSKTDLNGKKPSIVMIESNRSDGKTTAVLSELVQRYRDFGEQCFLLYRYQYELSDAWRIFELALKINDMQDYIMYTQACARGLFYEIHIQQIDCESNPISDEVFGYSIGLHNPDAIKKYSPMFAKVTTGLFDEFQSEKGKYLPDEVGNLQSILTSIARGGGEHIRDITLYMCSNKVSLLNPYYIQFDIHKRRKEDTKFIRGDKWIAHFNYNPDAATAIKESGIGTAFGNTKYIQYATDMVYLYDATVFVENISGKSKYFLTIIYDGKKYGVRLYRQLNIIHVSEKIDPSCRQIYAVKASDHVDGALMIDKKSSVMKFMLEMFKAGNMRFDNIKSKNAIFDILSIDMYK